MVKRKTAVMAEEDVDEELGADPFESGDEFSAPNPLYPDDLNTDNTDEEDAY